MNLSTISKVVAAIVVVISLTNNGSSAQAQRLPPVPCPNTFAYLSDGDNYYGLITLRDVTYGTTTLQLEMTEPGTYNSDYVGRLGLNFNKDRVYDYLKAGTPITYRVDFPHQNPIPRVHDITVNGVRICSGPKNPSPKTTLILKHVFVINGSPQQQQVQRPTFSQPQQVQRSTSNAARLFVNYRPQPEANAGFTYNQQNPFLRNVRTGSVNQNIPRNPPPPRIQPAAPPPMQNTITNRKTIPTTNTNSNPNPISNEITNSNTNTNINAVPAVPKAPETSDEIYSMCGQENSYDIKRLAYKGQTIIRSRFPWIVAIYMLNASSLNFRCGGNLISARTVVSAAHCFPATIPTENLLLSFGRHNLSDWHNAVNFGVQRVITHPDYGRQPIGFDADIAILQLRDRVRFSLSIRPICLWQGPTDTRSVEGTMGSIVGWGEDEAQVGTSTVPKLVNATIVSELTCIRSNEQFFYLTSNRTLCAGNRDGSGPCVGDSGSGLMIRNRNKWMLRGTVSASLGTSAIKCKLDEYVIYSDVAKFTQWIMTNML